jgi:hypothetical protein
MLPSHSRCHLFIHNPLPMPLHPLALQSVHPLIADAQCTVADRSGWYTIHVPPAKVLDLPCQAGAYTTGPLVMHPMIALT